MKRRVRLFFVILFTIVAIRSIGQDRSGITGVRDSTYTRVGEFKRLLRYHPDIRLVEAADNSELISRDVTYRVIDGIQLVGDFYHSVEREERSPGILIIHGGGWRSGDKEQLGALADQLALAGYSSFAINYRLSTQALYPAAVCDVKAALRWMRLNADSLGIDPGKIVALGFSAGGQLAALVGTTAGSSVFSGHCSAAGDDGVQAIVDIDGILAFIHPESGEGDDSDSKSAASYWFGYTKAERPDLWYEASALTHVSEKTPPTLFINSAADRMHAGRDDFIRVLDRWTIYHETKVFRDAPHSFCLFDPWFTPMVGAVVNFLNTVFE